jgi:hypothetical protein
MGDDSASLIYPLHNLFSALRHGFPVSGLSIDECQSKCLRAEGGPPSDLAQQPLPTQVTYNCEREGDAFLQMGVRAMG